MKKVAIILMATALFALSASHALASVMISGDVTAGTGVFTITEDIVFDLTDGTATNPNADPYAILFHDWNTSFGATVDDKWAGGKHQLDGGLLDLRREPDPFSTETAGIFVSGSGQSTVLSNELTSAPIFDGNFYNRGAALWFSDTYQRVRQLGFDPQGAEGDGDRFVIGAGSWDMPTISKWDLYGEFSGEATIYLALGYSETPPMTGSGRQIPIATTNLAPVPEPTTMMLFGIGLLSLSGAARRKN